MKPDNTDKPVSGEGVAERNVPRRWESIAAVAIATLVGMFFVATLRRGHGWGDDFAMYVMHARNFVEGLPYASTSYIVNPWGVPGPSTYPPVYPLMLAPIWAISGFDYGPMKVLTVLSFAAALYTVFAVLRDRLPVAERLVLIALLGFNPWFWEFKDELYADMPFLLFTYLALWLALRQGTDATPGRPALLLGVGLGIVIYLAYGTRALGIVLVPCIVTAELIKRHRLSTSTLTTVAVFSMLAVFQNAFLHSDSEYAALLGLDPSVLGYNAVMYARSFAVLWSNGYSETLRAALFGTVTLLAIVGYASKVRRHLGLLELFPLFYLPPIVGYWVGHMIQQRYVIPLLPLYLFYALAGLRILTRPWSPRSQGVVLVGVVAVVAAQYIARYTTLDFGEIREGVTAPHARAMFGFLRRNAGADDVIVMGKARACALYTARRCASPYGYRSDIEIWRFLHEVGARFIVVGRGPLAEEMDYEHPRDFPEFVERNRALLLHVFESGDLGVYRVEPAATDSSRL